jgi:acyl-CoA synthetase (AMP-forming)/AMP-acid ligase II
MSAADRIDALPRRWARERPDALRFAMERVRSRGAACRRDRRLRALPAKRRRAAGDRVLIVAENSLAQIARCSRRARSDAVAVPVNPRLSPRELDAIRAHAQPRVTLYAVGVAAEVDAHAARHGAACGRRAQDRRAFDPLSTDDRTPAASRPSSTRRHSRDGRRA